MDSDGLLQKYFNFDESDLFANRNGTLTPKQQKRLAEDEKLGNKISLFFGLLTLAVAIAPSIAIGFEFIPCLPNKCHELSFGFMIFFIVMFVVLWLPIWGYFGIRTIRKALSRRASFPLKKAEGRVNIIKVEGYNSSIHMQTEDYELHIGGKEFDCDSELADIMMQGDTYAVYYIGDTLEIMSAEMLAKAK